MKDNYRRTKTTVSLLRYHFVFCPYRRRKVFLIPGVEDRVKELVTGLCDKHGYEILAMECHIDHVHLFLSAPPDKSPAEIMASLKGPSSRIMRQEFKALSGMKCLWTRSYFVSTAGNVSSETIRRYVETQKTR